MQHICRRAGNRQSYYAWFQAMHTRIDLLFVADRSEDDLNRVAAEAERVISEVEAVGNCFSADSELSRLNRCAPGETMLASDMLFDLLTTCKEYNRRTQGLFDVTVESERHDATTIEDISLGEGHTVALSRAGVYINMSGILKGYALDGLRSLLQSECIGDALMSLGNSSIMALGAKSGCEGWPISDVVNNRRNEVILCNECYTTSGNVSGVNHYIVNPLTNNEIEKSRKVSVVTHSGIEGEVLSTAYLIADSSQRTLLDETFRPRCVVIDGTAYFNP